MKRELQIDYLKGLAIISVILLHSLTINQRDIIGGTYYILQAIPVFLILAGYNTIRSYLNKGITDLNSCYEKSYLMKKFKRIVLPYIFIWILELLILVITKQPVAITAKNLLILFIIGGWGPGGYFVALMVQFIIIIPVLYKIAQFNKLFNAYSIVIERIKADREIWGAALDVVANEKEAERMGALPVDEIEVK